MSKDDLEYDAVSGSLTYSPLDDSLAYLDCCCPNVLATQHWENDVWWGSNWDYADYDVRLRGQGGLLTFTLCGTDDYGVEVYSITVAKDGELSFCARHNNNSEIALILLRLNGQVAAQIGPVPGTWGCFCVPVKAGQTVRIQFATGGALGGPEVYHDQISLFVVGRANCQTEF